MQPRTRRRQTGVFSNPRHLTLAVPQSSGQVWIGLTGRETFGNLVVSERAAGQRPDRTAPACQRISGPNDTQ
jgi:hypothetical protein